MSEIFRLVSYSPDKDQARRVIHFDRVLREHLAQARGDLPHQGLKVEAVGGTDPEGHAGAPTLPDTRTDRAPLGGAREKPGADRVERQGLLVERIADRAEEAGGARLQSGAERDTARGLLVTAFGQIEEGAPSEDGAPSWHFCDRLELFTPKPLRSRSQPRPLRHPGPPV